MDVREQALELADRILAEDDWYRLYVHMVMRTVYRSMLYGYRSKEVIEWEEDDKYGKVFVIYSAPANDSDPYDNLTRTIGGVCGDMEMYVTLFIKDLDTCEYALVYEELIPERDDTRDMEESIGDIIYDIGTNTVEELLEYKVGDFKKLG